MNRDAIHRNGRWTRKSRGKIILFRCLFCFSLSFLEDYAEGIKTRIEKRMACTFSLIEKRRFFRLRDFLEPRENRFQGILLINSFLLTRELFLVACFILDK